MASIKIDNYAYQYAKPNVCPHCGVSIDATVQNTLSAPDNLLIITFKCTVQCCEKIFSY